MNKSLLCVIPAHTIDVSKSTAEGARKDLLCVRFRVIYGPYDSPDKRKNVSDRQKVKTEDTLSGFQDFSNFPSTYHQGAVQY